MIDNNKVRIEGCGCRFRKDISSEGHCIGVVEKCEHLCDSHRNEFILEKYNEHVLWKRMIESDANAMDAMNKEMKEQEESLLTKDGKRIDIGKITSKLDEINKE